MREKHLKEQGLADLAYRAESDHEVQMARADLYKIGKYAIKLHEMLKGISEREGLDGWVQAKITKAADYISSVYHHLDYETKFEEVTESNNKFAEAGPMAGALPAGVDLKTASNSWQGVMTDYVQGRADPADVLRFLKDYPVRPEKLVQMLRSASLNPKFVKYKTRLDILANTIADQGAGNLIGMTPNQAKDPANQELMQKARRMDAMGDSIEYKGYLDSLLERKLTKGEDKKKEKYVKGMKKAKDDFKDRYGKDAKAVMYATATKMAKKKKTESATDLCAECGKPSYTTLDEEKQKGVDGKVCWKGYKRMGTKKKGGKTVDNCVKM